MHFKIVFARILISYDAKSYFSVSISRYDIAYPLGFHGIPKDSPGIPCYCKCIMRGYPVPVKGLRIDTGGWAVICVVANSSATKSHTLMINIPSKSSYYSLFIHVKHCKVKKSLMENENLM